MCTRAVYNPPSCFLADVCSSSYMVREIPNMVDNVSHCSHNLRITTCSNSLSRPQTTDIWRRVTEEHGIEDVFVLENKVLRNKVSYKH